MPKARILRSVSEPKAFVSLLYNTMKKIILASASPRRRELLSNMGAEFEVITCELDERSFIDKQYAINGYMSPEKQTELLALKKAHRVCENADLGGEYVVIGADTSVITEDNVILGKPKSNDDAIAMLRLLSGKAHRVVTGIALTDSSGREYFSHETTLVYMRKISDTEARAYVESEYVLDKAGAYAIQGRAAMFIKGIEGCYFNVVGLPVYKLAAALKNFDIDLFCGGI